MINDAEKFADEDAKLKGKVEARNELESYAYSLKNQVGFVYHSYLDLFSNISYSDRGQGEAGRQAERRGEDHHRGAGEDLFTFGFVLTYLFPD